MKIEKALDRQIDKTLRERNKLRSEKHEPSGKLSASMLGYPLQWQVLKTIGAKRQPIDDYTLRKFKRGDHVEDWLVSHMPGLIDTQVFCEYRDCIGYVDAVTTTEGYDFPLEEHMPHEIKSVTNMRFKYLDEPQESHALQGACYALGLNKEWFIIDYVATGDYRVKSMVLPVSDYKDQIDSIIDEYDKAMKNWKENKIIPEFEPKAKWQENIKYNNYPEYVDLTSDQALKLFEKGVEDND